MIEAIENQICQLTLRVYSNEERNKNQQNQYENRRLSESVIQFYRSHKLPGSTLMWGFLFSLIAVIMFSSMTSLDGREMKLSKDINESTIQTAKLSKDINGSTTELKIFQEEVELLFQEFKKTTTTSTTMSSEVTTSIAKSTTTKMETTTTKDIVICTEDFEVFPVPGDCHKYYMCLQKLCLSTSTHFSSQNNRYIKSM